MKKRRRKREVDRKGALVCQKLLFLFFGLMQNFNPYVCTLNFGALFDLKQSNQISNLLPSFLNPRLDYIQNNLDLIPHHLIFDFIINLFLTSIPNTLDNTTFDLLIPLSNRNVFFNFFIARLLVTKPFMIMKLNLGLGRKIL